MLNRETPEMWIRNCGLVVGMFLNGLNAAQATDFLLYNASAGTLPESQSWLFYAQDAIGGGTVSKSLVASGTSLATNDSGRGGWSNTIPVLNVFKNNNFPSLDPSAGFSLDWSMQVISESHVSTDRAGTSVILLGADNKGIEIGFWTDQVWAQSASPLFKHAESANFDTRAAAVDYHLEIQGSNYLLYANSSLILNGETHTYAAFGSAPYTLSNYFFIGDNTTSAGATTQFGSIHLITPVPEASSLSLSLIGIMALVFACRRQVLPNRFSCQ